MRPRGRGASAACSPHTRVEEDGLFPPMADEFPDHVEALRAEHARIEDVLTESAEGTPVDPVWPVRLSAALHTLRDHILKEQDGLFPAALASLGPADWEGVDEARRRVGSALASAPAVASS